MGLKKSLPEKKMQIRNFTPGITDNNKILLI